MFFKYPTVSSLDKILLLNKDEELNLGQRSSILSIGNKGRLYTIDRDILGLTKRIKTIIASNIIFNTTNNESLSFLLSLVIHRIYLLRKVTVFKKIKSILKDESNIKVHHKLNSKPIKMQNLNVSNINKAGIKLEALFIKKKLIDGSTFLKKLSNALKVKDIFCPSKARKTDDYNICINQLFKLRKEKNTCNNLDDNLKRKNLARGKKNLKQQYRLNDLNSNENNLIKKQNIFEQIKRTALASSDTDISINKFFKLESFNSNTQIHVIPKRIKRTKSMIILKNDSSNLSVIYEEDGESDKDCYYNQKQQKLSRLHMKYYESKSTNMINVVKEDNQFYQKNVQKLYIAQKIRKNRNAEINNNIICFTPNDFDGRLRPCYSSVEDDLINDSLLHKQNLLDFDSKNSLFAIKLIKIKYNNALQEYS